MTSYDLHSERWLAIYSKYYSSRFSKRLDAFVEMFKAMENAYKPNRFGFDLLLDLEQLTEAIRSYFLDVIRYKENRFSSGAQTDPLSADWLSEIHEYKRIEKDRVASLTVKWILRHRPVSCRRSKLITTLDESKYVHLEFVNEHYALLLACWVLEVELQNINQDKYAELLYYLRYRSFDEIAGNMLLSRDFLCADHAWT